MAEPTAEANAEQKVVFNLPVKEIKARKAHYEEGIIKINAQLNTLKNVRTQMEGKILFLMDLLEGKEFADDQK